MTTNKVVQKNGKWFVKSEDGEKNLGGPYDSEEAADKRLKQVEYFKHNCLQNITTNLTPKVRYDTLEGRKHLVVPMVMLTEGVHAGSNGPLYYDAEELGKTPVVWNGRPIVIYHPTQDGQAVSAGDPTVFNTRKVGVVMSTVFEGGKLKSEAWLDEERLGQVDDRVLKAIQNGRPMEISTGLFTDNDEKDGEWKGEKYKAIARNFRPDHLAILPDQKGACSLADGAGLLRNQAITQSPNLEAAYRVLGQALQLVRNEMSQGDVAQRLGTLLTEEAKAKDGSDGSTGSPIGLWPMDVYDSWFTYSDGGKTYARDYKKDGDNITLVGIPREVVRVVVYKTIDGKIVGNQARSLRMNKEKVINDLITNADSPWDEGDREYLTAMSEEKLEKFVPAVNQCKMPTDLSTSEQKTWDGMDEEERVQWLKDRKAPKTPPTKNDEVEVNDDQPLTLEEYIQKAPEELQEVLNSSVALHREQKGKLIATITANKANRFPQQVLASKSLNELQAIAALAAPSKKVTNNYGGMADAGSFDRTVAEEPLVVPVMNFNRG